MANTISTERFPRMFRCCHFFPEHLSPGEVVELIETVDIHSIAARKNKTHLVESTIGHHLKEISRLAKFIISYGVIETACEGIGT